MSKHDNPKPLFEGTPVHHQEMAITGKSAQPGLGVSHIGDQITVLVVGVVTKVQHADSDEGLVRTHTLKVEEAHCLDEGDAAELLAHARDEDAKLLDQMLGRRPLWDTGDDVDPGTGEIR